MGESTWKTASMSSMAISATSRCSQRLPGTHWSRRSMTAKLIRRSIGRCVKNGKYGPMGEDLFAQACLDKFGVRRVEAFDITTDGACPADRPIDQQKNKKWTPTCAWTATPAMHPFKKVADWIKCHDDTVSAIGSECFR